MTNDDRAGAEALETVDDYEECYLVLDIEPRTFFPKQKEFVNALADFLSIEPSEVEILGVTYGCTIVHVRIPAGSFQKLQQADWDSSEKIGQILHNEFKVSRVGYRKPLGPQVVVKYRSEGRELTWLHISDAHIKSGAGKDYWGQDKVRTQFVEQLPGLLEEEDLEPDFVFFTGDVAYSGKPEEYVGARGFVSAIMKSLASKKKARLFCVPGNHDVDLGERPKNKKKDEVGGTGYLSDNETVINFFHDDGWKKTRSDVIARLNNFFDFLGRCKAFRHPAVNEDYYYTTTINHTPFRIGVAGLNSAWRCAWSEDHGNLIIGQPQIDTAMSDLSNCDVRVVLIHHPVESPWYTLFDKMYQQSKLPFFDFVLSGHEHEPRLDPARAFYEGREYCHIASGALHTRDPYGNSFNVTRLNLTTGDSSIFFWHFLDAKLEWRVDSTIYPSGSRSFQLPKKIMSRLVAKASGG